MSKWWKGALHKICAALMTFTKISDLNQLCMGGPCYSHHRKLWWWSQINNKHLNMFGGFFVESVKFWNKNRIFWLNLGLCCSHWVRGQFTGWEKNRLLLDISKFLKQNTTESVKKKRKHQRQKGDHFQMFTNIKQQWSKITALEAFWNNKEELKAMILRGIMTKNLWNPNFFFGRYS